MILKIYRLFVGKLKLTVTGDFVERILNICTYNGITVWGIRKKKDTLSFYISVRDFKCLRKLIRGKGVKIHISSKRGMPFILNRYKKRYGIVAAVVMFFSILYFLSGFIWNINVNGNALTDENEIISACHKIGLYEGVRSSHINAWDKRVELLLEVEGLSWAAINIEGSVLTVDVEEADAPEITDNRPCNLIATEDGVIRKIESTSGDIVVSVGDAVTKGDLLVSGAVEFSNGKTNFVHSGGEVIAEVTEKINITVPLKQKIKYLNGYKKRRAALDFFSLKIPLYVGELNGEYAIKQEISKFYHNGSYLPIYLYNTEFYGIGVAEKLLSKEEAISIAKQKLNDFLKNKEIVEINETILAEEGYITLKCEAKVLINIAKEDFLIFSTTN